MSGTLACAEAPASSIFSDWHLDSDSEMGTSMVKVADLIDLEGLGRAPGCRSAGWSHVPSMTVTALLINGLIGAVGLFIAISC